MSHHSSNFPDKSVLYVDPSHSLAFSFALGTFISVMPTFGTGVFWLALVLLVFKKVNKTWLFLAFIVWNPLVLLPLYDVTQQLADFLFQGKALVIQHVDIWNQDVVISRRFLLTGLLMAFKTAFLSYGVIRMVVYSVQSKQQTVLVHHPEMEASSNTYTHN